MEVDLRINIYQGQVDGNAISYNADKLLGIEQEKKIDNFVLAP